jgi:HD-GYP domain-containing protein (c-di-GMP phosphodiesterase class II)
LTSDEWQIIRQHPEKGYRMAQAIPDLAGIADLILRHHEHWDGQGYPLGLVGHEIPIKCRILAVVDAYEVMTSGRPYKKAVSVQEAMEELTRCAGSQFDPQLVEVFIQILISRS